MKSTVHSVFWVTTSTAVHYLTVIIVWIHPDVHTVYTYVITALHAYYDVIMNAVTMTYLPAKQDANGTD